MRICLILKHFHGVVGGAERVVRELAEDLGNRGHTVSIVSFDNRRSQPALDLSGAYDLSPRIERLIGPTKTAVTDMREVLAVNSRPSGPGNEWWPTPEQLAYVVQSPAVAVRARDRLRWRILNAQRAKRLSAWLSRTRQDAVVAFLPDAIAIAGEAVRVLEGQRPRFVCSIQSMPNLDFNDGGRFDPNPRARHFAYHGLQRADAVTVLLPSFVNLIPEVLRHKVEVIPNPVQLRRFSNDKKEDIVLGVGRLSKIKRFDILLEAFSRLANDYPTWRLEICGAGPESARLSELRSQLGLAERAFFRGNVTDIDQTYARARVIGHPALFEGFGLAITEAISHGVRAVCFGTLAAADDLVEEGVTGFIADDGVLGFERSLRKAMSCPLPGQGFENAAQRLADRFNPQMVYDRWEAVIAGA